MTEILLDSNMLLRHLLQDIPEQSAEATKLVEEIEKGEKVGYISLLVMNELIWIFKKFYNIDRKAYLPQLLKILHINNMKVIEVKKEILLNVLEKMKKREIDFTDVYLAEIAGDRTIASFDQDFKKLRA